MDDILRVVKEYILSEFLPDEDPAHLTPTTPLITGGVIDSIATLQLVSFLEERFGIAIEAHEADRDKLDTLVSIEALVRGKLAA